MSLVSPFSDWHVRGVLHQASDSRAHERITIYTDAQAAARRVGSGELGPGQRHALEARKQIPTIHRRRSGGLRLNSAGVLPTRGAPGDEKAGGWAALGAGEPDATGIEHLRPRWYGDQPGQGWQPPRSLAHLKRSTAKCWWCPFRTKAREHLSKCRPHWERPARALWVEVQRETGREVRAGSRSGTSSPTKRCSQPILGFLSTKGVGATFLCNSLVALTSWDRPGRRAKGATTSRLRADRGRDRTVARNWTVCHRGLHRSHAVDGWIDKKRTGPVVGTVNRGGRSVYIATYGLGRLLAICGETDGCAVTKSRVCTYTAVHLRSTQNKKRKKAPDHPAS